jgi:hypothetical protein
MRSIETELPLRAEHTYTQKEKIREYERKKSVARASKYNFSRRPARCLSAFVSDDRLHTHKNKSRQ